MDIFDFTSYRDYLWERLGGNKRTGAKQNLSQFIGFQPALLSQILKGKNNLSLEAAIKVNSFLNHTSIEAEYFLNLVHIENGGTEELKNYYRDKNAKLVSELTDLKKTVAPESRELSEIEQARYYSNRLYALCHVAVSLKTVKTMKDLIEITNVTMDELQPVIDFLIKTQIIIKNSQGHFTTGPGHTFIDKNSPFLKTHHQNIRRHTSAIIETDLNPTNIHYATYFTLSRKDFDKLRKSFVELIAKHLTIIEPSEEEVLVANVIDFAAIEKKLK